MVLDELFEMQKVLDERIEKEHPRGDSEDRIAKKVLALQVELGELANEWRGFKFWSKDQEPRTNQRFSHMYESKHKYGFSSTPIYKNGLLDEYVDCLHFILSIGSEIGYGRFKFNPHYKVREEEITIQFLNIMKYAIGLSEDDYYSELLHSFVYLGESLGFGWDQIKQAYIDKNAINHTRQDDGY